MAKGTKVKTFRLKDELDSFLENHDVLSIQYSNYYREFGNGHIIQGFWVVWYKED